MQTLKIPYKTSQENLKLIKEYLRQYSSCLHYFYNRVKDGLSETEIKHLLINNVELLDAWFKQSCIKDAIATYSSFQQRYKEHEENREDSLKDIQEKLNNGKISKEKYLEKKKSILKHLTLIFGGKKNYFDRQKGNITKELFKENKLSPLYSIGTRSNPGISGNLKFILTSDLNLLFKPSRKIRIELLLKYHNKHLLKLLYLNQETRKFSLSYKLDSDYVYISFDETLMSSQINLDKILNRVLGIDMNPNYVGWSIVDWKSENLFEIVKSGIYSIKDLNDKDFNLKGKHLDSSSPEMKYISNKRQYETILIVKNIVNKAIYYKCLIVSIEDLSMKSSEKNKGKKFNKLVNNLWNRSKFVNNLLKRCNVFNIGLLKVKPEYSSFIGNFLFRSLQLPDMILASIELGRRGYEFYNQYISLTKQQKKNIVYPDVKLFNEFYIKSLEEFNIEREQFKNLKELYEHFKKSKCKYRLSINDFNLKFNILFSRKSLIHKL